MQPSFPASRALRERLHERPAHPRGRRRQLEDVPRAPPRRRRAARPRSRHPELAPPPRRRRLPGGARRAARRTRRGARASRWRTRPPRCRRRSCSRAWTTRARRRRSPLRSRPGAGRHAPSSGNDTFAVLRAGTAHGWGVAVVCGAGINCVGVARDGRQVRFPALGSITGDWGGGYDVGLAAVSAAARSEDGRGPRTSLEQRGAGAFRPARPRPSSPSRSIGARFRCAP